jgi:hypothetical protein
MWIVNNIIDKFKIFKYVMPNKCILPFIRYDFDKNSPCCKITNYDHEKNYQELLNDHRNDIKSKFCTTCWNLEKNGLQSKRQVSNNHFKKYLDVKETNVISVVLPTGNVCNLSCVTCGPTDSTGWIPKAKAMEKTEFYNRHHYRIPLPYNNIPEELLKQIKWDNVEDVEFLGGETLMSKNLWKYLDLLKEDTSISLLTNGTAVLKDWQIEKCKKFKNLHICFSIDGIEKIFEYIRQPAKWKNVKNNILFYKTVFGRDKLSFHITISNMNIFYIDYIMKELLKILPVKCTYNMVEKPDEFATNNLTNELGTLVEKQNPLFFKNKKIDWKGTKESMSLFFKNIKLQENVSKIYLKDYMLEYYKLIKELYLRH